MLYVRVTLMAAPFNLVSSTGCAGAYVCTGEQREADTSPATCRNGTPPGAGLGLGFKPPRFLKGGETIALSIEGLGTQKQKVAPYKA